VEQSKTSLTTIWRNEDNKVDAFNGPTWWLADFVSPDGSNRSDSAMTTCLSSRIQYFTKPLS